MVFWIDQFVTWATALAGWWIIHQTSDTRLGLVPAIMRIGIGLLVLALSADGLGELGLMGVPNIALLLKAGLGVLFAGVILFHYQRFRQL
ncbi:hypothetical protein TRICHSKD4_1002 [Roseibium sp. TrichSKD4]|uniref:hypothetical protein n=1 Tax=Roseibium sp. TrichSKD4 TaxID=744980 RepID=UPI0001E5632B|nr:hypothetical protein [Roseibium sp. TrichSKD4]EFO33883.1 hypothetical protein TRICHSKD4_1002 [Roseibium sp. TrichSKD4]